MGRSEVWKRGRCGTEVKFGDGVVRVKINDALREASGALWLDAPSAASPDNSHAGIRVMSDRKSCSRNVPDAKQCSGDMPGSRQWRTLLRPTGKSMHLAREIRHAYARQMGRPLAIKTRSLEAEIRMHVLAYDCFHFLEMKTEKWPLPFLHRLNAYMMRHTEIIDCGEHHLDNNRFVFDIIGRLGL